MNSDALEQVVLVEAADRCLAVALPVVARVFPAVAITPMPGSKLPLRGTINMHGSIVPVVDLRHHLGLPTRPVLLSDCMMIVDTSAGPIALCVDAVKGVAKPDDEDADPSAIPVNDPDAFLATILEQLQTLETTEASP